MSAHGKEAKNINSSPTPRSRKLGYILIKNLNSKILLKLYNVYCLSIFKPLTLKLYTFGRP